MISTIAPTMLTRLAVLSSHPRSSRFRRPREFLVLETLCGLRFGYD